MLCPMLGLAANLLRMAIATVRPLPHGPFNRIHSANKSPPFAAHAFVHVLATKRILYRFGTGFAIG